MVLCLAIGTSIGELLGIEKRFQQFGEWLKKKTGSSGDGKFVTAFVTASLTVCIGSMAIEGGNSGWTFGGLLYPCGEIGVRFYHYRSDGLFNWEKAAPLPLEFWQIPMLQISCRSSHRIIPYAFLIVPPERRWRFIFFWREVSSGKLT